MKLPKKCRYCHEDISDDGHWCVHYANWTIQGMFDFIKGVIDSREEYKSRSLHKAATAGFSSCIITSAAMIAELTLKTLLVQHGHNIKEIKMHDLSNLYELLNEELKERIQVSYNSLNPPFSHWRGDAQVEQILKREQSSFVSWRYLPEYRQDNLNSNPYHLISVAAAVFSIHVEDTELPEFGHE